MSGSGSIGPAGGGDPASDVLKVWLEPFRALLHRSDLDFRPDLGHGRPAGAGKAHGDVLPAHHWAGDGRKLRLRSPSPQSGPLDPAQGLPAADPAPGQETARRGRTGRHRTGRHHRAAMGPAHQRLRHLPRSRPLQPRPLCQGQRPALAQLHAADAAALAARHQGPAVPDPAGAVGGVGAKAGTSAQAADRTGAPGHAADPQMAAGPLRHLRRRQQLRNP